MLIRFRFKTILPLAALLAICTSPALAADGDDGSYAVSAGVFNLSTPTELEAGLEYRGPAFRWGLQAAVGFMVTEQRAAYIYGGLRRDFDFKTHWGVALSFGAGFYHEGNGKDLGGPFNYRSGIELYRRFDSASRLGLVLYHLSHARLYDTNPGSNTLMLSYDWSLGR